MTEEEYDLEQKAIAAAALLYVLRRSSMFRRKKLTPEEWVQFLGDVWPAVRAARSDAAFSARRFYDAERLRVLGLDKFPLDLQPTNFQTFVQNMEPVRVRFSQKDAPEASATQLGGLVVREVRNAGRGQIIRSVKEDEPLDNLVSLQERDHPEKHEFDQAKFLEEAGREDLKPSEIDSIDPADRIVRGWARVATGLETCEWCLMLVSRGPVYLTAKLAGSRLTDDTALRMDAAGTDTTAAIKQWHPNCDCKVVPVFKISKWKDRHAWKNAEDAWISAQLEAIDLQEKEPDRVHKRGKNKGKPFTLAEDTLNILRDRLKRGEVSMKKLTGLAG